MTETKKEESRICILVAMPQLLDPNFFQTTSLLSEFTTEGAMAVVLNRPLGISVEDALGDVAKEKEDKENSENRAFWGGPIQNERGFVVHEDPAFADESLEIEPGLYLSGSSEVLKTLLKRGKGPDIPRFRLYLGYAGWGPGQLEQEIADSSWVTVPLDRDLIFDDSPDGLWQKTLGKIGVDPSRLAGQPQGQAH